MTTITDPKLRTNITVRTVLLTAADITRMRGHCATGAEDPGGGGCVWTLLNDALVALGVWADPHIRRDIEKAMQHIIGDEHSITWSNRHDAASVINMFERAAFAEGKRT